MTTATEMKEHPILFSGPMVRAILAGQKTQTRRVIKPQPHGGIRRTSIVIGALESPMVLEDGHGRPFWCPYGKAGSRLWVRETWAEDGWGYTYRATNETWPHHWAPSIFMPRKASRITLEIVDVKAERLWEISEFDMNDEGIPSPEEGHHITPFKDLWNEINAKRGYGWESNPWVWAITFKRI